MSYDLVIFDFDGTLADSAAWTASVFNEVAERYGPGPELGDVAEAWRPFRTWAVVHLRALREQRTHEIAGHTTPR